ncbi:tail fiber assembly protein [Enterobacter cloacae]
MAECCHIPLNPFVGLLHRQVPVNLHLRAQADSEIDRRQDAVDAGIATEEETTALSE